VTQQDRPTAQLARFLADLTNGGIPAAVEEIARRHLLDVLAGLFAGRGVPEMETLLAHVAATAPGEACIPATSRRCAAPAAAGATAALCHAAESDPIDSGTTICAGAVTVPAALILCQHRPVTGRRFLAATVGGYEAGIRLGRAAGSSSLLGRGFWPTAVCGAVAAAATGAVALELDADRTRHALGLAAVHAGGLATGGAEAPAARSMLCAATVRAGLDAVLAAEAGMAGPAEAFDGERGFLAAFANAPDPAALTDGLGERWSIGGASQKAWPCALQAQSAVDALRTALAAGAFAAARISKIVIDLPAAMRRIVDRPGAPATHFSAAASIQFLAAALILDGDIAPRRLGAEGRGEKAVLDLMKKVMVRHDPALDARFPAEWPARVTVRAAGREETREVSAPPGHPSRPLTFAETADRFRAYAAGYLDTETRESVIALVDGLADAPDAGQLAALLCC